MHKRRLGGGSTTFARHADVAPWGMCAAASPPTGTAPLDTRRAGVLLHPTSLPSPYGVGDLGPAAYRFVDFLAAAGCTVWQVLPLVPTHPGDGSPYNATSAMAGNPELVSLDELVAQGLLTDDELVAVAADGLSRAEARTKAVERVLARTDADPDARRELQTWCAEQAWLEDYATFVVLRRSLGNTGWSTWPKELRDREPEALAQALAPLQDELTAVQVEQWLFATQWDAVHRYAHDHGVLLFGDLPIFVSYDSADVWSSPDLFLLDEEGRPTSVTGVPPDYFSAEGQRWNNPHYDWKAMARDGFAWWRGRVARQRELFDLVRIDHFRGFESSWHVPADAPTAIDGEWVKTPGAEVLAALVETSGAGTLVAEDLGLITAEVDDLRLRFGLPGMKVLHFAFDGEADNAYLPENHEPLSVVYTGTHDNDTTVGWWSQLDDDTREQVAEHLAVPDELMPWALVRLAMASSAQLAVVPAQDLLALGSESRMNTPGTAEGNWLWQTGTSDFDDDLAARVRTLVERYDRLPPAATGPTAP